MNLTPEFRTSREWKKFKRAVGHDAAMEFIVNIYCEIEGITRKMKQDEAYLGTKDPEDVALMCGADMYDGPSGQTLIDAFLDSGLMIEEDGQFRMIGWEAQNANLISNRRNGRKGGARKSGTEGNGEAEGTEWNGTQPDSNLTDLERNGNEPNSTERNRTDGIAHGDPTVLDEECDIEF